MKPHNLFIIISLATLTSACGHKKVLDIEPDFQEYVQLYEEIVEEYTGEAKVVDDLIIEYGELENPLDRGLCIWESGATPRIIIEKYFADLMGEGMKESMMLHEIVHCDLRRLHRADTDEFGNPLSIMYPYTMDSTYYWNNRDWLHEELVSRKNEF